MIKNRHIGKFEIKMDYINKHPEEVKKLMVNMIVISAEYVSDTIKYVAINSELFNYVEPGCEPEYYTLLHY